MSKLIERIFLTICLITVIGGIIGIGLAFVSPPMKQMDPARQAFMLKEVGRLSAEAQAVVAARAKVERNERKIEKAKGARP